ncbi:MAG: RNA-binding protein [Magnetococcales bacterium]|nr:RNA-binding protein [Magnetococcales bacterium]MBF0116085.1 RNA-binding protein [Magnetococcales bacterium]
MTQPAPLTEARFRLDKWLWAARFFKTRPLATEAVVGGKVHLNGARTKPGHETNIGDTLSVRTEAGLFVVLVRALSNRRGPAREAVLLYEETAQSQKDRAAAVMASKTQSLPVSTGRPSKKDRRALTRLRDGE